MFYLEHVRGLGKKDSFYSQYGKFAHELIDAANRNSLSGKELLGMFTENYFDSVTLPHPLGSDAGDSYFYSAYDYFADFTSVIPGAEILCSEQKYVTEMFGGEYSGIIDMLVRLPDGPCAIVDHKSTSAKAFSGKSGDRKFRQLYLYSLFPEIRKLATPDILIINCFRESRLITRPFDPGRLEEAVDWAESTAYEIRFMLEKYADAESAWETVYQPFWCTHVCGCSDYCEEMM